MHARSNAAFMLRRAIARCVPCSDRVSSDNISNVFLISDYITYTKRDDDKNYIISRTPVS